MKLRGILLAGAIGLASLSGCAEDQDWNHHYSGYGNGPYVQQPPPGFTASVRAHIIERRRGMATPTIMTTIGTRAMIRTIITGIITTPTIKIVTAMTLRLTAAPGIIDRKMAASTMVRRLTRAVTAIRTTATTVASKISTDGQQPRPKKATARQLGNVYDVWAGSSSHGRSLDLGNP
jgi:hypothetical protein